MKRLTVDERRILHTFGEESEWMSRNPTRPYEEVTVGLAISVAYPSLSSLIRQGLVAEVPDGYALTVKGFEVVDELRKSRLD